MKTERVICDVCEQPALLKNCNVESLIGPGAHYYQFYTCGNCLPHINVRNFWQLPAKEQQNILEEIGSEEEDE
jgi:hypothetical protein